MIELSVEPDGGIIQVVSIGEASRSDIDVHYDRLRAVIATMRDAGQAIRVLSDQTRAIRLSDELNLYLKHQIERTYLPDDRLALVMASQDDKAYARSVLGVTTYAVFESRLAAEMWLMETTLKPPS